VEKYWIWFSLLKLSDRQKKQLLEKGFDPQELFRRAFAPGELSEKELTAVNNKDLTRAEKIRKECEEKEIKILTPDKEDYPPRLRNVEDAPWVLYCDGKLPQWGQVPLIGVVGTREMSSYGAGNARRIGKQIAACGGVVVSGGALGADTCAMEGAISQNMPVVCVLGTGVDVYYPSVNSALFDKVKENGCLISEYPPGTKAQPWQFPRRNRIISGISHAVLVVEAPVESGALITAAMAKQQGRDLYVVPGNVGTPNCAGSNQLLQQGASAAMCGWDVMRDFESLFSCVQKAPGSTDLYEEKSVIDVAQTLQMPRAGEKQKSPNRKKSIDKEDKSSYSVCVGLDTLSEEERYVAEHLSADARPVEELLLELDMPSGKALSILTKLTLMGVAVSHPGKEISLK
jgi:DNA processing protein